MPDDIVISTHFINENMWRYTIEICLAKNAKRNNKPREINTTTYPTSSIKEGWSSGKFSSSMALALMDIWISMILVLFVYLTASESL